MFNLDFFIDFNLFLSTFHIMFSNLVRLIYILPIIYLVGGLVGSFTKVGYKNYLYSFILLTLSILFFLVILWLISWVCLDFNLTSVEVSISQFIFFSEGVNNLLDWNLQVTSELFWFYFVLSLTFLFTFSFYIFYMESDPEFKRFSLLYLSFYIGMLGLILSVNFMSFFINWEIIGFFSFMLITFWNNRLFSLQSGKQALFINKLGDICLLLGFMLLYYIFKSSSFSTLDFILLSYNTVLPSYFWVFIFSMFLIASYTKSAQWGFHQWLPAAMEGPTPVSALLHAATLVTAGVVLWLKLSLSLGVLEYLNTNINTLTNFNVFYILQAVITCFGASCFAMLQLDIKKTIAFSTTSHLGLMFLGIALKLTSLTLLHLIIHAIFKSLMFVVAGILLNFNFGEQDLRRVKQTRHLHTQLLGLSGLVAGGLFFTSGFYSKELILEHALYVGFNFELLFVYYIIFSWVYCFKLSTFTYQFNYKVYKTTIVNNTFYTTLNLVNSNLIFMLFMLLFAVLAIFSIGFIYSTLDLSLSVDITTNLNLLLTDSLLSKEEASLSNQLGIILINLYTTEHFISFILSLIIFVPMVIDMLNTNNREKNRSDFLDNLFSLIELGLVVLKIVLPLISTSIMILYLGLVNIQFYLIRLFNFSINFNIIAHFFYTLSSDYLNFLKLNRIMQLGNTRLYFSLVGLVWVFIIFILI